MTGHISTAPIYRCTRTPETEPDGLCTCPTIDPADARPDGSCRRCYRLHPDAVSPRIQWDRTAWEANR